MDTIYDDKFICDECQLQIDSEIILKQEIKNKKKSQEITASFKKQWINNLKLYNIPLLYENIGPSIFSGTYYVKVTEWYKSNNKFLYIHSPINCNKTILGLLCLQKILYFNLNSDLYYFSFRELSASLNKLSQKRLDIISNTDSLLLDNIDELSGNQALEIFRHLCYYRVNYTTKHTIFISRLSLDKLVEKYHFTNIMQQVINTTNIIEIKG